MTPEQETQLKALVLYPEALAYASQLDVDALLTLHGDVRLVAAEVLAYACTAKRGAAGESGAVDIKLGSLSLKTSGSTTADSTAADAWCARAALLRSEAARHASRRARLGSVSVPVQVR